MGGSEEEGGGESSVKWNGNYGRVVWKKERGKDKTKETEFRGWRKWDWRG